MSSAIRQFCARVRKAGVRRKTEVKTVAMGREREFQAWDVGDDTFIFEDRIQDHLNERPSVLVVPKSSLTARRKGWVMTMTTGNHSVAAFPLLDGRFWKLSHLPMMKRGDVLMGDILCCNIMDDKIEASQRDVASKKLYAADAWLTGGAGFRICDIVMSDRNEVSLEHYRELGQEWRIKPLVWTESAMRVALGAAKKRIGSKLRYYHSTRGVHFLTLPEFRRFVELAESAPEDFVQGLRELVSTYDGNRYSFTRMPKFRGHHEIEFFGLKRGISLDRLVPELERLMEAIVLGRVDNAEIARRARAALALYESLLTSPEMADEESKAFVETLYMHVTGEIYAVMGEGSTPSFDDRRTALPGATFDAGRPMWHPGVDDRSEVLLSNLRGLMSKDEIVEYANVYEIHVEGEDVPLGKGMTREIVYKTNRSPLEHSLIEKRLASSKKGYGAYMMARIGALKALGVKLSDSYKLLRRRAHKGRAPFDFYIRSRCEGEPLEAIPANYFCNVDDSSVEEKEVVLGLAYLMGDAAAQNMAMKKYDPKTQSPLYGVGKEIYEFEYDMIRRKIVPKSVSTCSVRGSFGWPSLSHEDDNLASLANFYMGYYAHSLKVYQRSHKVSMAELAERFFEGFAFRTHVMAWQLSVMRDRFEGFTPRLPTAYGFDRKWQFILWSLERQERRLGVLRRNFFQKVQLVEMGQEPEAEISHNDDDNEIEIIL